MLLWTDSFFNQRGCSGVNDTLLPLGCRRIIRCVLLISLDKRTLWTSGGAAHLHSALITNAPPGSSVYPGLSQTRLVLLWHRKQCFFKPATHSPESSCVITWETHALYTCSHVHNSALYTLGQILLMIFAWKYQFQNEYIFIEYMSDLNPHNERFAHVRQTQGAFCETQHSLFVRAHPKFRGSGTLLMSLRSFEPSIGPRRSSQRRP